MGGLEKALQRVAAGMDGGPKPMVRHRTGTVTAYTAGELTVSVQIGQDTIDAPFLATFTPTVGDMVSVLINNGSPVVLGPVNKVPAASSGGVIGTAQYEDHGPSTATNYQADPSTLLGTDGDASSIAYSASPTGLLMVDEGWYQAFAYAQISGLAPTDTATIQIHWPNAGSNAGIDAWGVLANGGAGGAMTATTAISRNFSANGLVTVNIYNPAGGTINTVDVQLTRLAGP